MDALPSKLLKNDAALDAGPSARGTRVERCFATAIDRWCFGGAGRDRTDDLLLAKQALSQLSYSPYNLVGLDGLEPSTPALSRRCSNQLSYRPVLEDGDRDQEPRMQRPAPTRTRSHRSPGILSSVSSRNR